MNIFKKTFILYLLFAMALTANAQFKVGVRAGFNASTIMGGLDIDGIEKNYKPGFHAGIAVQYMFTGEMGPGIESGLYYSAQGVKIKSKSGNTYKNTYNPSYLQLPVAFVYKIGIGTDLYLVPSLGVYGAYGLGGKVKTDILNLAETKVDFFDDDTYKRFDFGGTAGLNVQYSGFTIGVGYDYGFLKINQHSVDGIDDSRNGNVKVSLGYFF